MDSQPIARTEILEERGNRDAFRLALAILVVFSLFLAALIVVALRVQVISITLPERAPARPAAKNSSSSAGRNDAPALLPAAELTSCAAAANRSNPLRHAPAPAAGEKENPNGIRTADRRGGGVVFIYHPMNKSAAGVARVTRRMIRSGHLAMAVSASPDFSFQPFSPSAFPHLRGLDSAAFSQPGAHRIPRGGNVPRDVPGSDLRSPRPARQLSALSSGAGFSPSALQSFSLFG